MTTRQSLILGIKSSGGYFISTFLFGVMFGIAASSAGINSWHAMLMSGSVFSASAQFASLEFWIQPLPLTTIAVSVVLVSARNILLGMSMADHFDGHSLLRRISWLFLLNDPGVVTALRLDKGVDRLGYVMGYGLSLMTSWLVSTLTGILISDVFAAIELGSLRFAGPLVMATMMILFAKGSESKPMPWIVSGLVALGLMELAAPAIVILLISVAMGVGCALLFRRANSRTKGRINGQ